MRSKARAFFSPDGALLLAASGHNVQIRRAATGEFVTALEGHTENVTCCVWSKDGRMIATSSEDKTLKLWRGRQQRRGEVHAERALRGGGCLRLLSRRRHRPERQQ